MVFNLFVEKNLWFRARCRLNYVDDKIKSSWVKHSWFYSSHENHEDISPRKFPAIRYFHY